MRLLAECGSEVGGFGVGREWGRWGGGGEWVLRWEGRGEWDGGFMYRMRVGLRGVSGTRDMLLVLGL